MSDTLRAVALLLSLALWSPVAARLVQGEVSPERAGLLYAAALLLALLGCALLGTLVKAYAPADAGPSAADPESEAGDLRAAVGTSEAARRQEDAAA